MTFDWALIKLREGKAVYRSSQQAPWSNLIGYIKYSGKYSGNGNQHWESVFGNPRLFPDDLEANDWEEYIKKEVVTT